MLAQLFGAGCGVQQKVLLVYSSLDASCCSLFCSGLTCPKSWRCRGQVKWSCSGWSVVLKEESWILLMLRLTERGGVFAACSQCQTLPLEFLIFWVYRFYLEKKTRCFWYLISTNTSEGTASQEMFLNCSYSGYREKLPSTGKNPVINQFCQKGRAGEPYHQQWGFTP